MSPNNWVRHTDGKWCDLMTLNLADPHFENLQGVYIIWHGGTNPAVVRVGQGVISDRLSQHRNDSSILAYRPLGLYATWIAVHPTLMDGVERFLAEKWNPKVGDRFPDVAPVQINSPW